MLNKSLNVCCCDIHKYSTLTKYNKKLGKSNTECKVFMIHLYVDKKQFSFFQKSGLFKFCFDFWETHLFLLEDDAVADRGKQIVEVELVNAWQPTMLFSKFHQSLSKPMVERTEV